MKTVLITGATGDVGTHLARELAGKYKLRLSDQAAAEGARQLRQGRHLEDGRRAAHHQGRRRDRPPRRLLGRRARGKAILQANIIGCYNVFEAARRNGVKRIAVPDQQPRRRLLPPRPDHRPPRLPEARQPLRRVEGVRRSARQPVRRQVRHGGLLMRIGNVQPGAARQAPAVDLDQPARHRAAGVDRHRASRTSSSRSSTASRATSALVRQLERRAPRLPAAGRLRRPTRRKCWRRRSRATTRSPRRTRAASSAPPRRCRIRPRRRNRRRRRSANEAQDARKGACRHAHAFLRRRRRAPRRARPIRATSPCRCTASCRSGSASSA